MAKTKYKRLTSTVFVSMMTDEEASSMGDSW